MEEKRLLIFGVGFIADNYVRYLHEFDNRNLTIKILFNKHKLQFQKPYIEHFPMVGDQVSPFLEKFKPTHILSLHGNSFISSNSNVRDSMDANALKTIEFLEVLSRTESKKSLKKILITGSASEYGKFYHKPIREDFPLHATSLYGLSKISLYNASMYYHERGLPIVHVRQFNTIGPMQRDRFVLPSFCKQVAEIEKRSKKHEIMVGDLTQERDFIDIRDTCRAYSLLFEKGCNGEAYNVASGKYISIKKLLDLVLEVSHIKNSVSVVQSNSLIFQENRLSKRLHADISKLRSLGFELKYSLRETVKDTLDYWRRHV